jgi:hypothetical protein
MVGLAMLAMGNQQLLARSNETAAAFTATQLVRQFTLKNTVAQVNQGMQGYVQEVNGQLRSEGMGPTPINYPLGMGSVPGTVNLPQRDGAGRPLGYCAWDNSSSTSNASYLAGSGVSNPLVHAVISPGLNGTIETTCAQILANGLGNNDDYVLTTAPTQASSRQFRSSVGTEAELFAMSGENGDVRLVTETNRLYSYLNGSWSAIGPASTFTDDSAANGAGAISYTAGKVTVGDFQAGSAVITGAFTAGSLAGNGSGLTDLNMSNAGSGVLSAAFGGTGVDSSAAANGQLLIGNGSGFSLGGLTAGAGIGVATGAGSITISNTGVTSLAGTLDQVIVNGATGDITLSLPQAIGITSSPTFGGMSLNGALAGTDASFTGAVNVGSLSVAGVPATLAFSYANSTGDPVYLDNLALGAGALAGEKRGGNVALGPFAMSSMVASANTTHGVRNTALGSVAMYFNQTGRDNVAVGEAALFGNTTGDFNTAVGRTAIYSNTTGSFNSAFGERALFSNTTGQFNTAIGQSALFNSTGSNNVALGQSTMSVLTSGQYSTGLGQGANVTNGALSYATAIGASALVSTNNTVVLGSLAANKNIAVSTTDDQVVIGATARNDTQLNTRLYVNGAVNIADKLFVNGVEINKNGTTNASEIDSGLLSTEFGGTGVDGSAAANGQLLIGNGSGYTLGNITGTANQVNVMNGAGSITLGLPQDIASTSTPTFGGLALNGAFTGTTATFSGAVTAQRINVGTSAGGVTFPNLMIGNGAMPLTQSGLGANTAIGGDALGQNTNGYSNSAVGYRAMRLNQSGAYSSAFGELALEKNVSGAANSAMGAWALRENTNGSDNSAVGAFAMDGNTTGFRNTALGYSALSLNTTGNNNLGLGASSGVTTGGLIYASGIGAGARVSTSNTLMLGRTATDQVVIGSSSRNDTQLNTRLYVNGAVNIADKLFVNGIEITASSTNASDIDSGLLGTAFGGTGVDGSSAANGQLLIGNGSGYTLGNITGTANQVTVTNGAGTITLGLPQDIATTSTPTFGGLTLNGALAGTTANFSGRLDAATLFIGGVEVLPVTKASVDAALTFSSDTGDINFNQPNLSLGAGALSASNRAANVAIGASVLGMLTADPDGSKGVDNTGVGYRALFSTSTGYRNTALGARAAHNLTTGYANTTIGRGAGFGITAGYENTVIGENALFNGAASYQNIAIGKNAMQAANTAYNNIALGNNSLLVVTSGYENTGIGRSAMNSTTSGFRNIGIGMEALRSNTTGNYNMGIGYRADVTSGNLVYAQAIGNMAQVATSNTLVLGGLGANKFGSTTDDQVVIGATSRNDAEANTVLYVNGTTHINGKLYTTDSHITARMQINTGLPNGLHFGGNTENLDTTSIYRFNQASDQTYLRVRLSDNNQGFGTSFSDEFQIGYQDSGYTPTFRVAGSGDVISSASITATAFNTSSDRRLKNNLQMQDADALLNKLSSLSAYSYDYVGQRDLGRRIGVIAQDMLPLFPEAVNVRPDGFYAVDYGALGALAAAGVGRLNDRVVELDKAFKESGAAQTVARIDTLEGTVTEHGQRIGALESWKLSAEMQLTKTDERLGTLETWRTAATEKMDTMQNAIDLNIQKIADNAIAIQANTVAIERLDDALFTLDGRVKNNSDLINNINARWAQNFNASEDGSVLTVNAVELKVSNFTAQNMRASTVYSQRLEAEMARIAELEVNSLRANSAVANTVQAEQLNTGSTQVYAGVGMPAVLFSAKSDGHYTVNTSALDGSYATATVIVNAGQAKVVAGQNEGIELYAEGNTVKALAAGKSIRASWIKTG